MTVMDEMAAKLTMRRARDRDAGPSQDVVDSPARQHSPKLPGASREDADLSALLRKRRMASERDSSPGEAAQTETAPSSAPVLQKPLSVPAPAPAPAPATFRKPGKPVPTKPNKVEEAGEMSSDQLQRLKVELMNDIRKELETMKSDIIAAVRREISNASLIK
jgi:hypothetical protein